MNSWLWLPLALFALHRSLQVWKETRRGHGISFSDWLLSGGGGYLAWNYGLELWGSGTLARGVVAALVWSAATPLLAVFWYGGGGRLRRWFLRAGLALAVFVGVTLASATFVTLRPAVALGGSATLLLVLAPRLRQQIRIWSDDFRHRRQRRQVQRLEARRLRLDEHAFQRSRQRAQRAEQKLEQSELELTKLREREVENGRRLALRRRDVLEQIQIARAWERDQSREHGGMSVHPSSYGFLLLEAARVLRHEIASGDRIPPIENDQFLFEVAERLLESADFSDRYVHQQGAKAAQALHGFLQGEVALRVVSHRIDALDLTVQRLAPLLVPCLGAPTLLEAWLIPHRRFQQQQRQRYRASQHPHQAAISDFLRSRCSGIPEASTWQTYWDDCPAVFVHGQTEPRVSTRRLVKSGPADRSATSVVRVLRWFRMLS